MRLIVDYFAGRVDIFIEDFRPEILVFYGFRRESVALYFPVRKAS